MAKLSDEQTGEIIGKQIAHILGIKRNRVTGRYPTWWGDKTAYGLRETIRRLARMKWNEAKQDFEIPMKKGGKSNG